jgi:hypothetical protein
MQELLVVSYSVCRYIQHVPKMLEERYFEEQKAGYSGLAGGYHEERDFLDAEVAKIMPDGHEWREEMEYVVRRVSTNGQWPWHYKVKAVQQAACLFVYGKRGQ